MFNSELIKNFFASQKNVATPVIAELAAKMPVMTTSGRKLSPSNVAFLMFQAPEIIFTKVTDFDSWGLAGRGVRKGAKAFLIFIPKEAEEGTKQGFDLKRVFDITQTYELKKTTVNDNVNIETGRNPGESSEPSFLENGKIIADQMGGDDIPF